MHHLPFEEKLNWKVKPWGRAISIQGGSGTERPGVSEIKMSETYPTLEATPGLALKGT